MGNRFDKGHGNTRLPYGLCKKYRIELPNDATPRQAWDAFKKKTGITAEMAYKDANDPVEKRGKVDTSFKNVEDIDSCLDGIFSKYIEKHREKKEYALEYKEALKDYLSSVHSRPSIKRNSARYKSSFPIQSISKDCKRRHGFPIDFSHIKKKATHDDYAESADAFDYLFQCYGDIEITSFQSKNLVPNYTPEKGTIAFYWIPQRSITFLGFNGRESRKKFGSYERILEAESAIADLKSKPKLTRKEKEELKQLEFTRKFKRLNVANEYKTMSVVIHEFGHAVLHQYLPEAKYKKKIRQIMKKALRSGDAYKYLSSYAYTDYDEFYAECFTAYHLGQPLPQYIIDMVELPQKVHEGKVRYKDLVYGCSTFASLNSVKGGNK